MTLRIGHNIEAMAAHRSLGVSSDRLAKAMQRLSSGLRINTAGDDAAGLGVSEKMRAQIRGLEQANRNIQDGISLLQTMEGALEQVHSILQRARELAVEWNGGAMDFQSRALIQQEMFALSDEISRIEDVTSFNGIQLLADNTAVVTLQVGANDGEIITVSLFSLFGPGVGDLVRPNTFFALPWVEADVYGFDLHIDDVSQARGRVGAVINRLEHAMAANQSAHDNLMDAESRIRDVDFASELTEMTKQQLLQSSGTTMLIFANYSSRRVLDLLSPGGYG